MSNKDWFWLIYIAIGVLHCVMARMATGKCTLGFYLFVLIFWPIVLGRILLTSIEF